MESTAKTTSRKKFFLWSAGVLTSVTAFKYFFGKGLNKKKSNTVKMLTQDGILVEVDQESIDYSGKRITDKELQLWVKK